MIDVEHTAAPAKEEYIYARAECRSMHVLVVGVAASNVGVGRTGGRSSRPWNSQNVQTQV